jgi:hypothetical protein
MAIAGSCENDLSILEKWFNCNYDSSPYSIWVQVGPGTVGGGASNYGYEADDESSRIYVGGTYQPRERKRKPGFAPQRGIDAEERQHV